MCNLCALCGNDGNFLMFASDCWFRRRILPAKDEKGIPVESGAVPATVFHTCPEIFTEADDKIKLLNTIATAPNKSEREGIQ